MCCWYLQSTCSGSELTFASFLLLRCRRNPCSPQLPCQSDGCNPVRSNSCKHGGKRRGEGRAHDVVVQLDGQDDSHIEEHNGGEGPRVKPHEALVGEGEGVAPDEQTQRHADVEWEEQESCDTSRYSEIGGVLQEEGVGVQAVVVHELVEGKAGVGEVNICGGRLRHMSHELID